MSCDWSRQFVFAIGARVERNGLCFMVEVCGFEPNLSIWHFGLHAQAELEIAGVMGSCWKGSHFVFGTVFDQRVVPSAHIRISVFIGVNWNVNGTQFLERDVGLH